MEEEDGSESDAEGAETNADGTPKVISSAHRTALAKASSVIEWLMTALGVRSGGRGGGKRQAQQVGGGLLRGLPSTGLLAPCVATGLLT